MHAIITGGSRGLGFHIAKEIKDRGYDIILISRNEEALKNSARILGAEYYVVDLAKNYEKIGDIIRRYKPYIVVNNAGVGLYGEFREQRWENLRDMLNVNIMALTYITKIALESMKEGYILNISSVASCRPQKNLSIYAATKAYVAHFSKSLAKEEHVHISYLLLGPTKTDFFKNANMPTKFLEKIMMDPSKVAKYTVNKMFKRKKRIVPGIIYKFYCLGK